MKSNKIINELFWNLCNKLKNKTNVDRKYIEYISALLYLKYYKNKEKIIPTYEAKDNINEKIDEEINNMKKEIGNQKIFSDIQFKNIIYYQTEKEENILMMLINKIELLGKECTRSQIAEAYEFAIKQSAINGDTKRTDEIFYTPEEIANIMVEILIEKEEAKVYDPICSSGNFLIKGIEKKKAKIFGEGENIEYYNIFKTRKLLKEIKEEKIENMKFDYAIMNPPFSKKNWNTSKSDAEIFYQYGLSRSAVGDYAYVLRTLNRLKEDGKMAVILPHGVLFRENEKEVRKNLIEKNEIEAIIGLPENLFYDTRIPVIILIVAKNRKNDTVLFIDASNEYENIKGNHILKQENQNKIIDVYKNGKEIKGYSRIVDKKEIREKEYNLSIIKYVRKEQKKNSIAQAQLIKELKKLENDKNNLEENIKKILTVLEKEK